MRLPLLTRVILALVLVGIVPLAVVLTDRVQVHQTLRDQVLAAQILAARTRAERISDLLEQRETVARSLAHHPLVASAPGSTEVSDLLSGYLLSDPALVAIVLLDERDREILRAQRREYADQIEDVLAEASRYVVTPSTAWLASSAAFESTEGRVVTISFAGELVDVLNPQEIGAATDQAILEADGSLVAGTISSVDQLPADLLERALVSGSSASGQIGSGVFGAGEQQVLGAYFPVPGMPWIVVSQQRAEVAEARAHRMDRLSRLAILGALLLIALTTTAAYATVVRPIQRLLKDQKRLIGIASTDGGDEIDQLRASLEVLERRIEARQELNKVFLGRYQVIDVLGEGGMGTVFRAWDPVLQRPVALKTVRVTPARDDEERGEKVAALLGEAVAIARINHPNVVNVFDVQQERSAGFIAMELVDGMTLEDYQELRGCLEVEEVVPVAAAVARALKAAHEQGLVHHDVKPGNILLGRDGSIKVVDFGIARFASELAPETGTIFGTPGYLPPEALTGNGYGETGDLFSLGVIMYESLTGKRLFRGASLRETLLKTVRDEELPIQALRPEVPDALSDVIHALLQKEPLRREAETHDLVQRLEQLVTQPWTADRLPAASRRSWLYRAEGRETDEVLETAEVLDSNKVFDRDSVYCPILDVPDSSYRSEAVSS